jgi:biofilm protein TabA
MILDMLTSRGRYGGMIPGFERALEYLSNTDFTVLVDGKYTIDGDRIYALVMTYSTEPERERSFEAHRKYLDVQCILQGWEIIYWAPTEELSPMGEYSEEKDIVFLSGETRARLQLTSGSFAVFYPEDAHKPNCDWNGPQQNRKAVIKVRIG